MQYCRQKKIMKTKKPQQTALPDGISSDQKKPNAFSDQGKCVGDSGSDGQGPVGQLVPGEQIARERKEERGDEQSDPDIQVPDSLAPIGRRHKNPGEMQERR